jgi:hypothetical protein
MHSNLQLLITIMKSYLDSNGMIKIRRIFKVSSSLTQIYMISQMN